ncbi:hypothetical protein pb186bvf_012023 [Paramecium bursaria]
MIIHIYIYQMTRKTQKILGILFSSLYEQIFRQYNSFNSQRVQESEYELLSGFMSELQFEFIIQ